MLSRKSDNTQVNFVITSPGIKQLEKMFNWGRGMLKATKRQKQQVFTQTVFSIYDGDAHSKREFFLVKSGHLSRYDGHLGKLK